MIAKKQSNTTEHNNLKKAIVVGICDRYYPHCWAIGRSVGTFFPYQSRKPIHIGTKGESDVYAIIHGKSFFIEVKTRSGVLSKDQKSFREMITRAGGHFIEARDLQDALLALEAILEK